MNRILYFASAVAACASLLASCEDKLPESKVFPYETSLISIKIVNAGADGNTVVEGVVDEDNKQVTFPKLDKDSPLSALKVEATVSDGAELTETTSALISRTLQNISSWTQVSYLESQVEAQDALTSTANTFS